MEDADAAFVIFDQDGNGDATRDEIEMACLYVPRLLFDLNYALLLTTDFTRAGSSTVNNFL